MDIFSYESARRIGDQNVLRKVDALLDWSLVLPLLIPVARKADSLYGFQFRRNLNLCVQLSWRNRWDEL